MRLSLRAIELCRMKFGKGVFCGFEQIDESLLDGISEEDVMQDFDELTESGIINFSDGIIHISALGHHIFNMMHEPEQYIMVDNEADDVCVRVYIRNTYYLCVIEERNAGNDKYILELLPRLDLVVGSFVYVLYPNEDDISIRSVDEQARSDIRIVEKAWNKERKIISEITICGNYHNEDIHYQMFETVEGLEGKPEEFKGEISELVNKLTGWMFEQISIIEGNEVC